jgi:hypothetical protein
MNDMLCCGAAFGLTPNGRLRFSDPAQLLRNCDQHLALFVHALGAPRWSETRRTYSVEVAA